MGEIAQHLGDRIVITSDNPRFEDPGQIIDQILTGIKSKSNNVCVKPERREAIAYAVQNSNPGDIILIAGKGHEDYQEVKGVKYPFDDLKIIQELIR